MIGNGSTQAGIYRRPSAEELIREDAIIQATIDRARALLAAPVRPHGQATPAGKVIQTAARVVTWSALTVAAGAICGAILVGLAYTFG